MPENPSNVAFTALCAGLCPLASPAHKGWFRVSPGRTTRHFDTRAERLEVAQHSTDFLAFSPVFPIEIAKGRVRTSSTLHGVPVPVTKKPPEGGL